MSFMHLIVFIFLISLVIMSLSRSGRRKRRRDVDDAVFDRLDDLNDRINTLERLATDQDRDLRDRFRRL